MVASAKWEKVNFEITKLARFFNGEQVMAGWAHKV
jgi:hypothetical protein